MERWGAPALVVLLVFVAYAPTLAAGFVSFDDLHNIELNHHFRGLAREHLAWMLSTGHMGHFHPLTWMSLGLDYASSGLDPAAYHRTNVALHALAAAAFYFVALRVLRLALPSAEPGRGGVVLGALAAALLFAVHPLRVESVAWVTERRDVLSGLLFVLTLQFWLRWAPRARALASSPGVPLAAVAFGVAALGALALSLDLSRREVLRWGALGAPGLALAAALLAASVAAAARTTSADRAAPVRWIALAVLTLALSLLSKAWGIVLPAVLLVLDAWPLRRFADEPGAVRRWGSLLAEKAPVIALSLAFARLAGWAQAGQGGTMLSVEQHGLLERVAQGFFGLAFYPYKTLVPTGLMPIYELPSSMSLFEPRFALPAALVVALTVALIALRGRWPGALAAWVAYAAIVSPVLGVAQSGPQLVADRYAYLSVLPLALLFGGVLAASPRRVAYVVLALVAGLSTVATYRRSEVWESSTTLWEAAYAVNPESPMTLLSLGVAREEAAGAEPDRERALALLRDAEELLQRGFELLPGPRYLGNLSRVHGQLARLEPERRREHRLRALEYSQRGYELASKRRNVPPDYRLNLAVDLLNLGRADEALPHLEEYVARRPLEFRGQLNHGMALGLLGRNDEAVGALRRAVELEPGSAEAWGKLGEALLASGRRPEAIEAYRRVLALSPDHPAATRRLQQLESGS